MKSLVFSNVPYYMKNIIQHYSWGTKGEEAFIPKLLGEMPDPDKAYAELWLGTHENGPSELKINSSFIPLEKMINAFPDQMLGKKLSEKYSNMFPFLLKILSAGEALSIQAHPDKSQATILHQNAPSHYPDANHKPEIAIALDNLTALVGIKTYGKISETLNAYPEIAMFAGNSEVERFHSMMDRSKSEKQTAVENLIKTVLKKSMGEPALLSEMIRKMKNNISSLNSPLTEEETLFLELEKKYGEKDIGLFFLFLLRMVHLQEGDGIFLKPGIPHAYIKGNIIECMANSDNVVRVGLTPKFKDTKTLVEIMDYDTNEIPILSGGPDQEKTVYPTSADEFEIFRIKLTGTNIDWEMTDAPAILLVTSGNVMINGKNSSTEFSLPLNQGASVFIPATLPHFEIASKNRATVFIAQAC